MGLELEEKQARKTEVEEGGNPCERKINARSNSTSTVQEMGPGGLPVQSK